ncbi:hypothetical protein OS493_019262 [Desmophyllum pertusum]|uniref:Uncharacterized protein n=1 Tax=Desmophyllum pertusum TaxID=174260 RepID=A0A9W9YBP2_9CNID|nr:hypothetical protein OS493_019262 [Desmophyllum pertusum]
MPLLYTCVQELRKIHGDDFSINVIYEDQPVNDFKSLFLRLQGLMPGPKSYLLNFPDVFVTTCGTNFYSQCFPPQTVNLAFSATSFHWFSRKPCDITGALHHSMITIPEEAEVFKKQAAKDWETILLNRAKELAPGSRMILVQLAIDKEGQYVGTTKGIRVSVHHMLSELWQGLVTDGLITQNEFHKTTFAYSVRTENEFKKPFESKDSPVRKAGLSLISIETKVVPCPYREKWLKNGGDPKEHAHWYIPAIRAWSNTTFVSGLSDSRSSEEKERIVDELFQRYENEVAKCPEDHGLDFVSAYMVIGKRFLTVTSPAALMGLGTTQITPYVCYKLIYEAAPLVLDAIKLASVKPGSVFTIADYGCADGGTSMPLLYACVQELRKIHGDDFSINVIYEVQPVNDFKSLFLRLQGFMPGPKSYLLNFPDVFVTTCGTNFYSQCFPPQTVNLAFSATAFHWLNIKPCDITGALDHTMITIPEEAEVFKKQAAKDWETILLNRAKELAPE